MSEPSPTQEESGQERRARLDALMTRIHACRLCQERGYLRVANPVAGARGRVTDRVMVIGQAPGHLSVEKRLPFAGPGGKVLQSWFVRAGFQPEDFRERIYLSALTRCDPGRNPRGTGDRKPSPAEQALCRTYLDWPGAPACAGAAGWAGNSGILGCGKVG